MKNFNKYLEMVTVKETRKLMSNNKYVNTGKKTEPGAPEWLKTILAENVKVSLQELKNLIKEYRTQININRINPNSDERLIMTKNGQYYSTNNMNFTHVKLLFIMLYDGKIEASKNNFDYKKITQWYKNKTTEQDFICLVTDARYPNFVFLAESYERRIADEICYFHSNSDSDPYMKNFIKQLLKINLTLVPYKISNEDKENREIIKFF